ncbi:AMP-dependent synthetase/ligase [Streptomonospora wellingtoniae]|uniref:Acyl-CoA synthetase n=1 Tax=Streptomonospora wellingtoniae TaxID=3075544 RepID=A0ABU2KPH3_9ACTN|nr:long-chain fatty acid--CoA ligase [Streptomonospora sp. DSM 45055]MDT0301174.1 long-chain fatty acid--CoA ligase [Streptomonospora sp. DSM 45055]
MTSSIANPARSDLPVSGGLADTLFDRASRFPEQPMLSRRTEGRWRDATAAEVRDDVAALAKGLIARGVQPGDRVGLLSGNRHEWTLLDYAIWTAGAVSVPIYPSSSAEQAALILRDSGCRACAVDGTGHAAMVEELRTASAGPEALEHVWCFDTGALDELRSAGADVPDGAVEQRRCAVSHDDPATVVYTSGTTGDPKGCVLTHRNFLAEIQAVEASLPALFEPGADGTPPSTLLFLPLAHVFGRMVQVGVIHSGARLGHTADVGSLLADLGTFRPTFLLAVPYVFEKIHATARKRTRGLSRRVFDAATETAVACSRAADAGGPGPLLRLRRAVMDRLVYRRLTAALGGRCTRVVSGGGALDTRLLHFYRGVGLEVYEGYGLTETTAAVLANTPGRVRPGTVGGPLPGVEARLAGDGELLVRGGPVFTRYWNRPEATRDAFVDGWFATGDLAEIDAEGFVRITGRKKEILVTAGGKNVAPVPAEERVCAHPLVEQCMLVGDGRSFVTALVTLDPDELARWRERSGYAPGEPRGGPGADPALRAEVQKAVDAANAAVSRAESIRAFRILPERFSVEDETLTPTLKLRRSRIADRYGAAIEEMYSKR